MHAALMEAPCCPQTGILVTFAVSSEDGDIQEIEVVQRNFTRCIT